MKSVKGTRASTLRNTIQKPNRYMANLGCPESGYHMVEREKRLIGLHDELQVLRLLIGSTKKDSPQQFLLIDSYWPMLANVHALAEELSDEQLENRSY